MQPRQMADSFFGFDTSLGAGLDERLDCLDDEDFGEDYDALNDETFGSEAVAGDWEQDHEKLSQITESNRSRRKQDLNKSETEIDVEKSLAHLVLDEKEVTIPRPGVWDSPTNFPILPPIPPKPLLSAAFKNACTVEELERGLISNRPPPGLTKPPVSQPQQPAPTTSAGNLLLNSITSAEKLPQVNGGPPSGNQFPVVFPPNTRLPPPLHYLQNVRSLSNQQENLLNYQLPPNLPRLPGPPYLPLPHCLPFPLIRPGPIMPPYNNHHQSMQHHNMHMGNHRNQNKHFNDRPDNHHQPFFRNNQHHHMNYNHPKFQNHHGHQHNHHQNHLSSNGIGPSGEQDEYAGLMNQREKQWLHSIQLLQLNTNQPYIDDYYYTVFCDRLNKQNANQNSNKTNNKKSDNGKGGRNNNNNNSNGFRDSRDREQPQHTFTKPSTTPMQFENSLGKLQYSSVTAPRKIIDMDVVPNSEPQQTPTIQQKDTKKTRQLLLEIERLYVLLLKLEDKNNPLAILAEAQREQQQKEQQQQAQQEGSEPVISSEQKDPVKEKEELVLSIFTSMSQFVQEDKLASFLSIRKGKMLFLRFLSCINIVEHKSKLNSVWVSIIKGLAIITRRDSQLLINFYTEFQKCISAPLFISLIKEFLESVSQPFKLNSLTLALSNKFGISVISQILLHINNPDVLNEDEDGTLIHLFPKFVQTIVNTANSNIFCFAEPWDFLNAENLKENLLRYGGMDSQPDTSIFELYFTTANIAR